MDSFAIQLQETTFDSMEVEKQWLPSQACSVQVVPTLCQTREVFMNKIYQRIWENDADLTEQKPGVLYYLNQPRFYSSYNWG